MAFRVFRSGTSDDDLPAADSADRVDAVLQRLEALAAALEALNGREPAADGDSVVTTLDRMERRDIQAVSAIDTFATALKSVSHHLAHLRQSVHGGNGQFNGKLDALASRLDQMQMELGTVRPGHDLDLAPLAHALDGISQRLSGLEDKLDQVTRHQGHWPFDADAFATALAAIADRLARVESKVDSVAQQPALEPEATSKLLAAIVERMGVVEDKVDGGGAGISIAACLMAVDRRLSRIETSLGMPHPAPAAENAPAPAAAMVPATEDHAASAPASGERVDRLLEQVFHVLAR